MKSTFIDMVNGKAIVKLEKAGRVEWLACRDFDDSKPEGTKWSSAQYFGSLEDAVEYAKNELPLFLITLSPDYCGEPNEYAVVRGRDAAVEYVLDHQELLTDMDITEELQELYSKDSITFGDDYGAVYIEEYELGGRIC